MNRYFAKTVCSAAFAAFVVSAFTACGENTSTEKIVQSENSGVESVADIADLPKCTADNDGMSVLVRKEGSLRVCSDGDWYGIKGGNSSSDTVIISSECTTAELADKSGIKILCNGDSVGVVLNGAKGDQGEQGIQGEKGETGAQGVQGEKGETGAQGVQGERGEQGAAGEDGQDGAGCTVVTLADNSGLKVLCGGDSVGVVLNGEKGDKGDQGDKGDKGDVGPAGSGAVSEGSSCNLVNKDCIVHVACGKDTVSLEIYSDDESCKEVIELDEEAIATNLEGIGGTSQKGPFLTGSEVIAYELLDGRSLQQTGKTFQGKILSDKGDFDIRTVSLASQYATLSAKGYYLNEVTGEPSKSQITLTALTNLRGRAVANINLLTHLENERAQYLVIVDKMTVAAAKKKAEAEVFNLFHIDSKDFAGYSEDLSVGGSSDADAALLAMSILLQGDNSEAALSAMLTTISKSIEETGKWDDVKTKARIADWAADADSAGLLVKFRKNVADWKLSAKVGNFEKYVRNFWNMEYGLGECTESRLGEVSEAGGVGANINVKALNTETRYICVDSSSADLGDFRVWRIATDFEKDTYGWKDSTDGALKDGSVTDKKYVYDAEGIQTDNKKAGWRTANGPEDDFGGCREELYEDIVTYRGAKEAGFYQCQERSHKWVKILSTLTIDTQKWKPETDGYAAWGDSVGVINKVGTEIPWKKVCYVYDESLSPAAYRVGNETDCTLGLMGCTKKQTGRFVETADDGNSYSCSNEKWTQITDPVLINTRNLACKDSNNAEMIHGTKHDMYFVCADGKWEKASTDDEIKCRNDGLCKACIASTEGTFTTHDNEVYGCASKAWTRTTLPASVEKARCVEDNLDSIIFDLDTLAINSGIANTADWICSATGWHRARGWRDYTDSTWQKKMRMKYGYDTSATSTTYFKDERDGQWYRKVTIGTQVWMAENLRYADSTKYVNLRGQTWCNSKENDSNCVRAGRYYTWTAAMDFDSQWQSVSAKPLIKTPYHRGICPEGWHIPTESEWKTMNSESGGYAAHQLIGNVGCWPNATNASGFAALPAGHYNHSKIDFNEVGSAAGFWSATEHEAKYAVYWEMISVGAIPRSYYYKYDGFSVRCLQDQN